MIAIIGILASMLLPALSQGKEQARIANCLNNLRQIGLGLQMYVTDHQNKYPPAETRKVDPVTDQLLDETWNLRFCLGGADPVPGYDAAIARVRPLYNYLRPSPVYRCMSDKGQTLFDLRPTDYAVIGCSYHYNAGALTVVAGGGTRLPQADGVQGIAGKPESWVDEPSRYILMHEPPARIYARIDTPPYWFQWHRATPQTEFTDPRMATAKYLSPIAFVDGHVANHDFTRALKQDLYYPYEPTKDWMWYKPAETAP